MNIYVIQAATLLVIALLENYGNLTKETKKLCFRFCVLILFSVLFFRTYKVGADLGRYHTHFKDSGELGVAGILNGRDHTNIGYYVLNAIVYKMFHGNYQTFISLTSGLSFFPVVWLIKKTVGYSTTALYIYVGLGFYSFLFTGLKQSIAMAILCFAMASILDNRRIQFYIWVVIASLFHAPALIFLPAYELTHLLKSDVFIYFSGGCAAIIYFFSAQLINLMGEYYDSVIETAKGSSITGKVLMIFIIGIYGYIFYTPNTKRIESICLLRLMFMAALLQMFGRYGNVFERLSDYYFVYVSIYIPKVFSTLYSQKEREMINVNNNSKDFYISVLAVLVAVFAYFWVYYRNVYGMLPYRTWLLPK